MKYFVLLLDGERYFVRFSNVQNLVHAEVAAAVQTIKVAGRFRDWKREFRNSEVISAGMVDLDGNCHGSSESLGLSADPGDTDLARTEQKYIVLSLGGKEYIFGFQKHVKMMHKYMVEAIGHLRNDKIDGRSKPFMLADVVGAGFVTIGNHCHGRSESLGISAREEDSALLASSY